MQQQNNICDEQTVYYSANIKFRAT